MQSTLSQITATVLSNNFKCYLKHLKMCFASQDGNKFLITQYYVVYEIMLPPSACTQQIFCICQCAGCREFRVERDSDVHTYIISRGTIPERPIHSFRECFLFLLSCITKLYCKTQWKDKTIKTATEKYPVMIMAIRSKMGEWQLHVLVLGWSELSAWYCPGRQGKPHHQISQQ